MARPGATVTVIHRLDRLDKVLAGFKPSAVAVAVFLLPAAAGKPEKRVIVRLCPGVAWPLRLSPGLVLHEDDGSDTEAAEAALCGADRLEIRGD